MPETTIQVLDKGPFLITGDVKIIDAEGNRFESKEQTALCRCGQSKKMPYCDGMHQGKFENCVRAKKIM